MRVEMKGGPQDGQIYPYVRSSAEWLHVSGWKVPIYYDSRTNKCVAQWSEKERA